MTPLLIYEAMKHHYPGFLDDMAKMKLNFIVKNEYNKEDIAQVSPYHTVHESFTYFFDFTGMRLLELFVTPKCNWWLDEWRDKTALPCADGISARRGNRRIATRVKAHNEGCTEVLEYKDFEGTNKDPYVEPPYVKIFTYEDAEQKGHRPRLVSQFDEDGKPTNGPAWHGCMYVRSSSGRGGCQIP